VQVRTELRQRTLHAGGRAQGLPCALLGAGVYAEQGHHAIARELVGDATGLFDRFADHLEIAVQQEHHVVGQAPLGERGEAAQVGKQHTQLALLAGHEARVRCRGVRRDTGG